MGVWTWVIWYRTGVNGGSCKYDSQCSGSTKVCQLSEYCITFSWRTLHERVEADSGSKLEIRIPGAGKQTRTRVYVREYWHVRSRHCLSLATPQGSSASPVMSSRRSPLLVMMSARERDDGETRRGIPIPDLHSLGEYSARGFGCRNLLRFGDTIPYSGNPGSNCKWAYH